jgi:hypothetical protein
MCSGNPLGRMDLATKTDADNPFFFFILGDPFIIPTRGWWPLLAASAYGIVLCVSLSRD